MKSNVIKIEKKPYSAPIIKCVELDNEISLQLQSEPPAGPSEGLGFKLGCAPEYLYNDPFKSDLG